MLTTTQFCITKYLASQILFITSLEQCTWFSHSIIVRYQFHLIIHDTLSHYDFVSDIFSYIYTSGDLVFHCSSCWVLWDDIPCVSTLLKVVLSAISIRYLWAHFIVDYALIISTILWSIQLYLFVSSLFSNVMFRTVCSIHSYVFPH